MKNLLLDIVKKYKILRFNSIYKKFTKNINDCYDKYLLTVIEYNNVLYIYIIKNNKIIIGVKNKKEKLVLSERDINKTTLPKKEYIDMIERVEKESVIIEPNNIYNDFYLIINKVKNNFNLNLEDIMTLNKRIKLLHDFQYLMPDVPYIEGNGWID